MKKLRLDVEQIEVDTFVITRLPERTGTVEGRGTTDQYSGCAVSCIYSECGGAFCEGPGPQTSTAPITCDTTSTMNPMAFDCVVASLAGPSCDVAQC